MEKLGWSVSDAKMALTKNNVQKTYGKHLITFFNPDIVIKDENGEVEAYPQVVVVNNHRGYGKLRFELGVFRIVCSNGLIVKEKDMGSFVLRHMGYSFEELRELVNKAVEALPAVVTKINRFTERIMSREEQYAFATKALQIRFGEERKVTSDELNAILNVNRPQDQGNDLYKVFNRVQEAVIRGGFSIAGQTKKGTKKVRRISNMLKDLDINGQLWVLAEEVLEPTMA
jgi:hydrogenase maturation factor